MVDGEQRVDQGLLAFLLVVAPDDLRPQGDLSEERQGEEDPDDPAVDDQRRDGIKGRVGGEDDGQTERQERRRRLPPQRESDEDTEEDQRDEEPDDDLADDRHEQDRGHGVTTSDLP